MTRFLAIFHGAADDSEKHQLTEEQQAAFLTAWAQWAGSHQDALVDAGAPLHRKKLVTSQGIDDVADSKTAYAILAAASLDEAAGIFARHPHLSLHSGNSIEVLECPEAPGQAG